MFKNIQTIISTNKIVLFMKGTKENPSCGFSYKVVLILKKFHIKFITYNVLINPALREGIKKFSNWPTIPQLYINGKFIGGCDIVTELYNNKNLHKLLNITSCMQ